MTLLLIAALVGTIAGRFLGAWGIALVGIGLLLTCAASAALAHTSVVGGTVATSGAIMAYNFGLALALAADFVRPARNR